MALLVDENLNCPTCGAEQPWSETCRRCKCDLSLLTQALRARRSAHQRCLRRLRAGDLNGALAAARRCAALLPDERARRLLAICYAARSRFEHAARLLANGL